MTGTIKSYALLTPIERGVLKLAHRFKNKIERLEKFDEKGPVWREVQKPVTWTPSEIYRVAK